MLSILQKRIDWLPLQRRNFFSGERRRGKHFWRAFAQEFLILYFSRSLMRSNSCVGPDQRRSREIEENVFTKPDLIFERKSGEINNFIYDFKYLVEKSQRPDSPSIAFQLSLSFVYRAPFELVSHFYPSNREPKELHLGFLIVESHFSAKPSVLLIDIIRLWAKISSTCTLEGGGRPRFV